VVFSSPVFLFAFLPITLAVIALVKGHRFQNAWLLGMSALFYFWGAGGGIGAILFVTLASYGAAFLPWDRIKAGARWRSRLVLGLVIATLLIPLLVFKYAPSLFERAGSTALSSLVLPLGISFFTFHAISYVVDVFRGTVEREANLRDYALYLFIFPHQIAGPIVRYSEIRHELKSAREPRLIEVGYGASRFTWGLAKKVIIADPCGLVADQVFAANAAGNLSMGEAWIGAFMYAMQIYFDFSGYSDMAIGLALMLGFRFPENFFQPYRSISVTDFWKRWHMTLTRWFRDYVYIPLGGNRRGPGREYLALIVVFTLTALWHGDAVTFLVWGGIHAAALLFERITRLRDWTGWAIARRAAMFVFIVISWVPFRAPNSTALQSFWTSMFAGEWRDLPPYLITDMTGIILFAAAMGIVSLFGPRANTGFGALFGASNVGEIESFRWRRAIPLIGVTGAATVLMVLWSGYSPFLYFQF
jgi:alginate O-acetyltransferase complex protein AlgI